MQPSRRPCVYASLVRLALTLAAARAHAETLTITSTPPGATVDISGAIDGNTPYKTEYPSSYFHKPHTVFSSRLEHSLTLRVTMEGYLPQQITLTERSCEWVAVTGRHHGTYFILRSDHFNVTLAPVPIGVKKDAETIAGEGPLRPASGFSAFEEKPAGPQAASVRIDSDPAGADVYVDGQFVGQTPSTLQLAKGAHGIQLKAPGRKTWERDLDVLQDSQLTLHPTLELTPR